MQLNYFPIKFDFNQYQIQTDQYSEAHLNDLRNRFNSTHSFFRNGGLIYISNKDGDDTLIGDLEVRNLFEDNLITSSLIKHIFFRTFKERFSGYVPVDFYPFRFFSGKSKDDIIYDILPDDLKDKISYKKLIEIQLRYTEIGGKKQFGFLINIRRNWVFNISCYQLHTEGYNLIGIDVLLAETFPGLDNVLAPNEELIGVIIEVTAETAKVETNDGIKIYRLEQLFLKKSKLIIGDYLEFATSQQKRDEVMNLIEGQRPEIYNTKRHFEEIQRIANHLFFAEGSPVLFHNKDGFCFTVEKSPVNVVNSIELRTPTFIFDPAATKTNNSSPDAGLSNYGPYDSATFDVKTPAFLCICNRNNRGNFTRFLSSLKDGVPNSAYFKKGLQKKYDLQDVVFNIRETGSYALEEYLKVISNYDENKPHLAVIEIPGSFKRNAESAKIYYQIKAKLLSLEIPVQIVTTEIINNYNEYILNSIALQIYAKLGGTPWVLPSQRSVDREIIIGIGHSWLRSNHYMGAEQNRVVGITTFMSSDGQYLLGDKVKDVAFEFYFEELLKSLKNSITRLSTEQGWIENDTVRLIFHIFKPIKNTEFEVVSQLIRDTSQFRIKFAFVTISNFHPVVLFDTSQLGVRSYGNGGLKGQFIPRRGSNVFLDEKSCIVQMFGANELKTAKQAMSKPVLITIRTPQGNYDNSDLNHLLFHDLGYITQQIFSFTYLSWRSFLPGEEPATMKYSNLISKLLGKMRDVPNWDADCLNYGLKRKKWFL
ncbi:Piwi domain-containing protein [Flavobacterium sp.]|uniref:Piwi domain-containing protein n=1 Tax=Flavobacterium sp. TaxID=239 RepID=UPI0031D1DDED